MSTSRSRAVSGDSPAERQLRFHLEAALTVGLTPAQIVETIIQLLAFAGNPRVCNAMLVAEATLAARDLLPVGQPAEPH